MSFESSYDALKHIEVEHRLESPASSRIPKQLVPPLNQNLMHTNMRRRFDGKSDRFDLVRIRMKISWQNSKFASKF